MTVITCSSTSPTSTPNQGECVHLDSDEQLYQVIGVDDRHDRCWLRRWPLARQGSEVFEISLQQIRPARPHRS
ncbi:MULTISPECIES: hypothetical protein [Aphanothece]|uniref:hypothetical protein n=1 Tax=Aphanothece TaxID=1121 RepID=UPI00398505FA